jgi:putative oxidoreductase
MKILSETLLLRFAIAIILISHSLHGIFTNNDVNDFGELFLNQIGFAPFGVLLAWSIVIIQIISAFCLILNKFIKIVSFFNIIIFGVGIITVHFKEGWFVVGAGRNGVEFSFLLICVLISIMIINNKKNHE